MINNHFCSNINKMIFEIITSILIFILIVLVIAGFWYIDSEDEAEITTVQGNHMATVNAQQKINLANKEIIDNMGLDIKRIIVDLKKNTDDINDIYAKLKAMSVVSEKKNTERFRSEYQPLVGINAYGYNSI